MKFRLVFAPEAEAQLLCLYHYIAAAASPGIAERYVSGVLQTCESLQNFPHRGVARDDVRPGLRITHHNRRTVIAFSIDEDMVSVIGVFHGGRNYEAALADQEEVPPPA